MTREKNIHEKLIQEWAKDTSQVVQFFDGMRWGDCAGAPSWSAQTQYRLKPYEITFVQKIVVNKHSNHVSAYGKDTSIASGYAVTKVEFTMDSETRTIKSVRLLT